MAWPPDVAADPDQTSRDTEAGPAPTTPDVNFVAPLQRRRLSEVTRMAFAVATQCLDGGEPSPGFIFCSRYGEYAESFVSLKQVVQQQQPSPTAFSMSVHNTAASQLAMHLKDRAPCSALAAGEATLESGFVEAWSQIDESGGPVMVIYHDQPLPALYREQPTTVRSNLALALLLTRTEVCEQHLRLAWRPSDAGAATDCGNGNPVRAVIRLLRHWGPPVTHDTGRLVWTWSGQGARP